ncbi:AraC family transcriptional regulator [Thermocoleostomius sinensis]|nr:AraC family transcriptional regulator [Thermocoleostomius sinensis]
MQAPMPNQMECSRAPSLSSRSRGWNNILVEYFHHPAGEGSTYYHDDHSICLSLASRPVQLLQIQGDRTQTGAYIQGDICLTPAQMPFFARWDSDDRFLQIRITASFVQAIASEVLNINLNQLEIVPECQIRDPQIEAIGLLLLTELQHEHSGEHLYVDSLTNVLAVHLLRHYTFTKPQFSDYTGGLPSRQLRHVLDYIHDHLHQEIKLADLASLLGISQYHFSHLFKQSIGIAPYQYLLRQRIERAKQLLHRSDRSITEIAFLCGFNSHSHLSQQFRQQTGMTPKAYRTSHQ